MLVLSRRYGEKIVIGEDIVVTILEISPSRVRLGIDAPKDVNISRLENHNGGKPPESKEQDNGQ